MILYDFNKKAWYHTLKHSSVLSFGKNEWPINPNRSLSSSKLLFSISANGNNVPLIGILASDSSRNKKGFLGNHFTFQRIQASLLKKGAMSIVFTPSRLYSDHVEGFMFHPTYKKWVIVKSPLPHIVYNRISSRQTEKKQIVQQTFERLQNMNIPYCNPSFLTKWETFQLLNKNAQIKQHLPLTKILSDLNHLSTFLAKHKKVYLKSNEGSKGEGVFLLCEEHDQYSIINSKGEVSSFQTIEQMLSHLQPIFKDSKFIIQEAISTSTVNGRRFDLRVLAHLGEDEHFIVSGIGVRVAGMHRITTHIPNGGSILPFDQVQDKINIPLLQSLIQEIGKELNHSNKTFFGEFSTDIGVSKDGNLYIFEINSKPMVFDEPSIKEQGLENLTKLLIMRANV
ncbi:YheC/YheD family protein [Bacillus timonensis]|nr:YheC/YheD family protein [Bacillus timonensis]